MQNITIINTGCANLSSVKFAFERLGYQAEITDNHTTIQQAEKLVLPGVGTALAAMQSMQARQLTDILTQLSQPVLGICLGMQLMTDYSAEGEISTLKLIQGKTELLPNKGLPLPHMGWNKVHYQNNHPLFSDIPQDSYFYFVHSYAVLPNENTIATCDYGVPFSAAIARDNFYGVQFHPERSGKGGEQLLRNFMENL
ncbi:imidazole glycerol phosphate synthase subunit HisH [Avibacterium paragallinarum]|uniref:Imidazole glycerol phosphate synthase subunit HisH n=1 Tax=Avibacterium paragallinarum TaxID=728 RepID=A0A0F5EY68_AVIPA|nr:imidazole glycerol phosphate synthase subunit HisH [Avibacterium paragallinarum]KAA6209540.1 imidazole glycerol phosphate synthase subunit HisH [Avibacterium paragallinarum]KKB01325.1 imidazole glycerol phosphate synthase [Avibacterium paragallinarum]POY46040.1 imidazole glycerol phosphate synthase subunit HisH [Avibacterium paragallinarum]RZN59149.1 imidazole glycerol phosphate synthase subunit HisH [Avibacterium paragallinarum]RZN59633.1 imidazole glycerol phosphate synthase subunit HisH 